MNPAMTSDPPRSRIIRAVFLCMAATAALSLPAVAAAQQAAAPVRTASAATEIDRAVAALRAITTMRTDFI